MAWRGKAELSMGYRKELSNRRRESVEGLGAAAPAMN